MSGARVRLSALVFFVLFVHNLPEGFAIGTAYASDTAELSLFVIRRARALRSQWLMRASPDAAVLGRGADERPAPVGAGIAFVARRLDQSTRGGSFGSSAIGSSCQSFGNATSTSREFPGGSGSAA